MKYKNGLVMLVIAVASITFGALAEKQTSSKRVFLLRAGQATAELRVDETSQICIQSTGNTRLMSWGGDNRVKSATGGFLLKIMSGTNSISTNLISIQADELVSVP